MTYLRLIIGEWLVRFAVRRVMPAGAERDAWLAAVRYGTRWATR